MESVKIFVVDYKFFRLISQLNIVKQLTDYSRFQSPNTTQKVIYTGNLKVSSDTTNFHEIIIYFENDDRNELFLGSLEDLETLFRRWEDHTPQTPLTLTLLG